MCVGALETDLYFDMQLYTKHVEQKNFKYKCIQLNLSFFIFKEKKTYMDFSFCTVKWGGGFVNSKKKYCLAQVI